MTELNNKIQNESNFILVDEAPRKWLTKDRFWNFVFWLGMSSGLTIGWSLAVIFQLPDIGHIFCLLTIFMVPTLVVVCSKTKYINDGKVLNIENNLISKRQMPTGSMGLITALGVVITFVVVKKSGLPDQNIISAFILFLGVFSGFSLYFIFKNCPISILFNRHMWSGVPYAGSRRYGSSNTYYENRMSPSKSYNPNNISYSSIHRSK